MNTSPTNTSPSRSSSFSSPSSDNLAGTPRVSSIDGRSISASSSRASVLHVGSLHVICKIAESEYAFAAEDVYQMETYSAATPVPGAPSYVIGLVQIRQQILPVLDLRLRFGMSAVAPTIESRIVVLGLRERLVGVLVDVAREVQNIAKDQFQVPPDLITQQSSGFVKAIAQLKNRIIMLLDSEKIVGDGDVHV